MFYCDMGPLGADMNRAFSSRIMWPLGANMNRAFSRTVGQYVVFQGKILPGQLSYKAHTIVTLNADGNMIWYKHRDRPELAKLTEEEQQEVMLQILKSEMW